MPVKIDPTAWEELAKIQHKDCEAEIPDVNFRRAYKLTWPLRTDALKTIDGLKLEDILDSYPLLTKKIYVRFSD